MARTCAACGTEVNASSDTCTDCQSVFEYNEERNLRGEERAYSILLECGNCGHDWEHGFKEGDTVDKRSNRMDRGKIVASIRRDDLPNREYQERVRCAVCGDDVRIEIKDRRPERFPIINKQGAIQLRSLFSLYLKQAQREREQAQNESEVIRSQGQIDAYQIALAVMNNLERGETEEVLNRMKEEIKS